MNCSPRYRFSLFSYVAVIALFLSGCIGDDLIFDEVDPTIRIINPVLSIQVGTTYQFEATYLNNVGKEESKSLVWNSSATDVLSIDANGLASALSLGTAVVSVEVMDGVNAVREEINVAVSQETVEDQKARSGVIVSTSSYQLEGNFVLSGNDGDLILDIDADYKATSALPGLYLYLSNNPNSTSGAHEVGAVEVFEGQHSYEIKNNIGLNDYQYLLYYCKPFNVKVGEGEIN